MSQHPPAVTDETLHLGTLPDDPTGVADCGVCGGRAVCDAAPCPACRERQRIRDAWWASGPGPQRFRRTLDQ